MDSKAKIRMALKSIESMAKNKEVITVAALVQSTGLSRSFFYKNDVVHARLEAVMAEQNAEELLRNKRNIFDKALQNENARLKEQNLKLKQEIGRLREENRLLAAQIEANDREYFQSHFVT